MRETGEEWDSPGGDGDDDNGSGCCSRWVELTSLRMDQDIEEEAGDIVVKMERRNVEKRY